MPLFSFNAVSRSGQRVNATKEARDTSELARLLREEGLILTSAKSANQTTKKFSINNLNALIPSLRRVSLTEKIVFTQNLAVMIGAGLSLTRALDALGEQTKNKKFSEIIRDITESIRQGNTLADSFSKHQKVFSELFINMVRVGEASGNLDEVLRVLVDQMKKDHELRSRVKSAMIYPAVIVCAMIGIGALMMITVVPKLTAIFKELGAELPLSTRLIILVSDAMAQFWWLFILLTIALILFLRFTLKTSAGKKTFDAFVLKLPIFGEIVKKVNSARLARTLSSLIKSGVPIIQGLQIIAGTLGNSFFRESMEYSAQEIQKGQTLSQSIKHFSQIYPPMVSQMIEVGEETGTLDEILGKLAEFYEDEVATITKGLSAIIEPILMVVIGAAVGFFAISMLQPMYSMMDSI